MPEKVALVSARSYAEPDLNDKIGLILDAAEIPVSRGQKVLVKPNLLLDLPLACTAPEVAAGLCAWLKDRGCRIMVSDSPAFGTAEAVARAIGLERALKPYGVSITNFRGARKVAPDFGHGEFSLPICAEALDCDLVFSVPRVKAHSQMRITLAVKNCFGCVRGWHKALAHMRYGKSADFFADMLVAVWKALPPVASLCDGITAMSGTGPRNGKPYDLGLLAASASAPACDKAVMRTLRLDPEQVPLAQALARSSITPQPSYPVAQPEDFNATGFEVPETLKDISFNPARLGLSLIKRWWKGRK